MKCFIYIYNRLSQSIVIGSDFLLYYSELLQSVYLSSVYIMKCKKGLDVIYYLYFQLAWVEEENQHRINYANYRRI